jgi:DNA-directed RNA polymerase subunit RPC12/RpoP
MAHFACPACKGAVDWPPDHQQLAIDCPNCGRRLQRPASFQVAGSLPQSPTPSRVVRNGAPPVVFEDAALVPSVPVVCSGCGRQLFVTTEELASGVTIECQKCETRVRVAAISQATREAKQVQAPDERVTASPDGGDVPATPASRHEPVPVAKCPSCNSAFRIREELMGKTLHCPLCSTAFAVPLAIPLGKPAATTPSTGVATSAPALATPAVPAKEVPPAEAIADAATLGAVCPSCGMKMQLPERYRSKPVRCPGCEKYFVAGAAEPIHIAIAVPDVPLQVQPYPSAQEASRVGFVGSTVQCYDCRYDIPVDESMSMLVNTGHSSGTFTGTGVGGGIGSGGRVGVGIGSFGGRSSSDHFGKVDLCVPCCELRVRELTKKRDGLRVTGFLVFALVAVFSEFGLGFIQFGFLGLITAVVIGFIAGSAIIAPTVQLNEQIRSAVRNGRHRRADA